MTTEKFTVKTNLRFLILEDSFRDFELICHQLENSGFILNIKHVVNKSEFEKAISEEKYDIILSDFNLPGFDAFGALKLCNEKLPETPFICVSGSIGEETAIEMLKLGAVDYVLKDRPERLPFAIKRALDEKKEKINHKIAAKALQESEFRFKQVAEEALEWIWEVDTNGVYTYSSPVVETLLGYTPAEVVGIKHFYDFFAPNEKEALKKISMKAFAQVSTFRNFSNPNIHKSGHIVILSTSGSPVFNDKKELIGYRGVDSDITEQTRTVEALIEAKERAIESDRLKTVFLQNLSHEIRTPMNGVLGFMELLKTPDLTGEQRNTYTDLVERSATRLINTINEIIEISRIETNTVKIKLSNANPSDIITELFKKNKKQIESIPLEFKANFPVENSQRIINTDIQKIGYIFDSLINNSIKFTLKGFIEIGYQFNNSQVIFFVKDTGIGIPADREAAIFKPFVQANLSITRAHEGAGLGLSIAKAYTEMLGGKIWFESELNKGTAFFFSLPI